MKRFAIVAGAIITLATPAVAMDYSSRPYRNQIVIDASGEIERDEAKRFKNWVKQSYSQWNGRKATAIVFDSPGGIIGGGLELGLVIADYHMTTGVAHGGVCASACVMAWAAGALKSAASDSKVGVHMAAESPQGEVAIDGTMLNIEWLQKTGAPKSVLVGAMSTKPDTIYWLSQDELADWGVKIVQSLAAKPTSSKCSDISDDLERLDCYDRKSSAKSKSASP
jgi:hypothetical protein